MDFIHRGLAKYIVEFMIHMYSETAVDTDRDLHEKNGGNVYKLHIEVREQVEI